MHIIKLASDKNLTIKFYSIKQKISESSIDEIIDLHIVKHRSGACGKISFKWEGSMVKFTPQGHGRFVTMQEQEHQAPLPLSSNALNGKAVWSNLLL